MELPIRHFRIRPRTAMAADSLRLYPTLPTLALSWTLTALILVTFRLLRHGFASKAKGGDARSRPKWPWVRCKGGLASVWRVFSLRAGFHRPAVWKSVSKRSFVATVVVAIMIAATNSFVLYLRTGSWMEQPYEWYSLQATGSRVFGSKSHMPSNILDSCIVPSAVRADSKLLSLDEVVSSHQKKPQQALTIVYVVPYGPSGVIEITDAQAWASNHSQHYQKEFDALRGSRQSSDEYVRATPVDALTMFPYLWHSILSESFSKKVQIISPFQRTIHDAQLEIHLIKSQNELANLEPGSNVFGVVQGMADVFRLADALPVDSRVGYVALSKEDCNNPHAEMYRTYGTVRFGMFPYGDCSIIDNDRFSIIPLGPSFEHGFPTNTHKTAIPSVTDRSQLLNLMVSWTVEKPTRIQALMAAYEVCGSTYHTNGLGCVIEHNDIAFKALQKVDSSLGLGLRWVLSSAPNAYVESLKQSIFTLCPFGKNPEQYRIWEALAAGSIPIIEDMPPGDESYLPGRFYHPSYPTSWKCRPEVDIHSFLKSKQAPVIFVSDWKRDLPRVIQYYMRDHPHELIELQTRARTWYRQAGEHLQAHWVAQALRFFHSS